MPWLIPPWMLAICVLLFSSYRLNSANLMPKGGNAFRINHNIFHLAALQHPSSILSFILMGTCFLNRRFSPADIPYIYRRFVGGRFASKRGGARLNCVVMTDTVKWRRGGYPH